jgi:hypothetical protein
MSSKSPPPFPWRTYTRKELDDDFQKLRDRILDDPITPSTPIKRPLVGYKCTNAFFQKERLRVRSQNKPSAIDYWKKNHKYVTRYNSNNDMFGRVVFLSFAPSEFSAYAAGGVYAYFMRLLGKTPETFTVQDFYSGWGNRMLGAMALGVRYIGCDANTRLEKPYRKLAAFGKGQIANQPLEKAEPQIVDRREGAKPRWRAGGTPNQHSKQQINSVARGRDPALYFQKSETLPKSLIPAKGVDIVFSSPPFFDGNLVEEYPGTESDYEIFMRKSLVPIMKRCLAAKIWVCLYIPTNMYNDLKKEFGSAKKKFKFVAKMNNLNGAYSNSNIIYCWKD